MKRLPSRSKKVAAPTPGPKMIAGVAFDPRFSDVSCLMWLFLFGRTLSADPFWRPGPECGGAAQALHPDDRGQPYTGSGRYEHAKMFGQLVWPKMVEFNPWFERDVQSFCEYDKSALSGGGSTGKSAASAFYDLLFYACCPYDTGVYIVSTTVEAAKKRIWKMMFALYPMIRKIFKASVMQMSPTPSVMTVLPDDRKDPAHGIFVIPLSKGEEVAIKTLKGFHPRRVLLNIDECDSVSLEVPNVEDNMRSGTNEFQAIFTGNDPSLFNALGQIMQPGEGQPVTLGHTEWDSISGVHCIRKDGFESPNVIGKNKWSGLMNQSDIDAIVKRNGGENTPGVYVMIRGLHPPEGVEDTVMSEGLIRKFHCSDWPTWAGAFVTSVLLDPAFGGDRCVIRRMDRGRCTDGKTRLCFHPPVVIPIDVTDKENPPEYQIAHASKTFCEALGVPPDEFIMDDTGTGRGTAAVLQREWSPRILLCSFGGAPSTMLVSDEDKRPANELYDRKVTELAYSFRQFVEADLIRGLDAKTAQELCSRHFFIKGTGQGKRIAVEKKEEMKARGLASPDFGDNANLGVELARRKGVNSGIQTKAKESRVDRLAQAAREYDLAETYAEEVA